MFIWEMVINTQSKLNLAMMYSFNGEFEMAKEVLEIRWLALYAPVYIFAIYDSYRTTVDLNNFTRLANYEDAPISNYNISTLEINYLDKRKPWVAFVWSVLMPGMGHLYTHRIVNGFFSLAIWILTVYKSNFLLVIHYSLMADWVQMHRTADWEWLMFLPSIYFFTIYDSYANTIQCNKLFDKEMTKYLTQRYANLDVVPATGAR